MLPCLLAPPFLRISGQDPATHSLLQQFPFPFNADSTETPKNKRVANPQLSSGWAKQSSPCYKVLGRMGHFTT